MRKIFLAPRSKETAYENFKSTIAHGVERERVVPYLTDGEKVLLRDHQIFYIWGNRDSKKSSWIQMKVGDIILFYAKGNFIYSGTCLFKKYSEPFAMSLWPSATEEKGGYWNCVFFVTNLQKTYFSLKDLNKFCGYTMKAVQGFMPINDVGVRAIETYYGSLDEFLSKIAVGINDGEADSISRIGTTNIVNANDLEKLDELVEKAGNIEDLIMEWKQKNVQKAPREIERVVHTLERNDGLVKALKKLYEDKCQICGTRIKKKKGGFYSEVAHIQAISTRAIGVDSIQNMLVLCPNHHKSLDHGKVTFEPGFKLKINNESITLHVNEEHPLAWPE